MNTTHTFRTTIAFLLTSLLLFVVFLESDARRAPDNIDQTSSQSVDWLPGTLVIRLADTAPWHPHTEHFGIPALDEALQTLGYRGRESLFPRSRPPFLALNGTNTSAPTGYHHIYVVRIDTHSDVMEAVRTLRAIDIVQYAEPYYTFPLAYTPNDPRLSQQYALDIIDAEGAWDISKGDTSIAIGVADAGVEWDHVDLADNIFINHGETGPTGSGGDKRDNGIDDDNNGYVDDWHGWDLVGDPQTIQQLQNRQWVPDNDPEPRRVNVPGWTGYHGTLVSGAASAATDNNTGIAGTGFNSKVIPIKCSGDSLGSGSIIAGYEGIRYAADVGARVINCSFGGSVNPQFVQGLQDVVNYAYESNALVVAASGNTGTYLDQTPLYPASLDNVLSVGATNQNDQPMAFSGYGVSCDLWAPGVNIMTTYLDNSYSQNSTGTSFSSPIVAGVAALVIAEHPDWTPDQVAKQLRVTGDVISGGGPYRYRRVNARKALEYNQTLTGDEPMSLPGVVIDDWVIAPESPDTIKSRDAVVTATLRLKNLLAPAESLSLEAYSSGQLTCDAQDVGAIESMGEAIIDVDIRLNPNSPVLYSEGNLQLILRLTDGAYEDYVQIKVPVDLPGWKMQLDATTVNPQIQYAGASIVAASPNTAWAVANVSVQNTLIPVFSRNAFGGSWNGISQLNTSGGALGVPIYTVEATSAVKAWAGSGPTSGSAGIYRTTDGGSSWSGASVATISPFVNGIHFWNDDEGIFLGDQRNGMWGVGLTFDGGESWSPLPNPAPASNSAEVGWNNSFDVVGDSIWFGTNQSRIWRSTDRGQSWNPYPTPSQNSFGVAFADGTHGMSIYRQDQNNNGSDAIAVTSDGGESWQLVQLPFVGALPQGVTAPPGTGTFYVGTQQGVYQTNNLGETWSQMAMPVMSYQGTLISAESDPASGLIGAYGTNAFTQLITYKEHREPDTSNSVLYPAADLTATSGLIADFSAVGSDQYRLTVDAPERVTISAGLWRVDGSRAKSIADNVPAIGRIDFDVSTSDLSSGVYIVVVRQGSSVWNRKVLIVR